MAKLVSLVALSLGVLLSGCGGTWVHPTKSQDAFTTDYNKCQQDVSRDPKLQQGLQLMILQATERCLQKGGWVLKEDD